MVDLFRDTADYDKNIIGDFVVENDTIDLSDLGLYDAAKGEFVEKGITSIFDYATQHDDHVTFEFDQTAIIIEGRDLDYLKDAEFIL